MARNLFINQQEIDFFNCIGKELIQDIVGETLTYYSVADKLTHSDDLYGEAVKKTVYRPVEINALVRYNAPEQTVTNFTIDTVYTIDIYFLLEELTERGIIPREGDFVKYGKNVYEVLQLTQPQTTYGRVEDQVQAKATCRIARAGQFKVSNVEKNG